jgi:glutamine amidotransferase
MIGIIDLGIGNFRSIYAKCEQFGEKCVRVTDLESIEKCDKIILPGVGSFQSGMKHLSELNLLTKLLYQIEHEKIPILGICLGMQLFTKSSEEGYCKGLGIIEGETKKILNTSTIRVPHMGWNEVSYSDENILFRGIQSGSRFYFAHSYHVILEPITYFQAMTKYGNPIVAAYEKEPIFGVQFHPERSHNAGRTLLLNFLKY